VSGLPLRSAKALAKRHVWILAFAALTISGCGEDSNAEASRDADLVVESEFVNGSVYLEGGMTFFEVHTNGRAIVDGETLIGASRPVEASVPAGQYVFETYQRPCGGTCDNLDSPTDRCAQNLDLTADSTTRVRILIDADRGCTVDVAPAGASG
jgi:hypothetical protein